ncbi:glycosyltransferase [Marinimicrobium sp. ABcell2]|uniref:glycosyltransferase n=1 Tax=Marinimicrobium sp. ABcell2 TaxID=3069751 RepID=UPI0027B05774|nr:glycosyltransferase [Marinimicrobium sp. ABcell2]MDQ2076178.1 glycosyltransferase [Marinimicrobium sp. ABcell2]
MKANRNAIVTITIGDKFWRMSRFTHPLLSEYAKKCGADFVVLDQQKMGERCGLPTYERFQLYDLFSEYDRIAFIDTDILVAPNSPSVFDLTPETHIGAANEEKYSQSGRDKVVTQEVLGQVDWVNPYINAGMMVLSKEHKELLNPDAPGLSEWAKGEFRSKHRNLLNDQPFINHRINALGLKVHDLGYRFNHTRVIPETHTRFRSYFIHYAGPSGHRYGERIDQIAKDSEVFGSKLSLLLSQKWSGYRWLADRMNTSFLRYLLSEKFQILTPKVK